MANMKKCDRCGQPYDLYSINGSKDFGIVQIHQVTEMSPFNSFSDIVNKKLDLCKPCAESFNEWLKNPIVNNED